jgi:hypothetical protein
MSSTAGILAALAGLVALWLAAAWLFARPRRRPDPSPESRLLRICRGDTARAERLVAGELCRTPGLSRSEAAARAIEKYQRDNR